MDDDTIRPWMERAGSLEGISLCPETAICLAALEGAVRGGQVDPDEDVVVFNTGAAQKYVEVLRRELPRLDRSQPDWDRVARGA